MSLNSPQEQLLNKPQAAEFLGISERTLSRLQAEGIGPPRVKIGRRVVYLLDSLLLWLKSQEIGPIR